MTSKSHSIEIPGYRIIRQIGEGGMSVVYLAYQESLKREVALKIMRPVIADEGNVVNRFKQEAEIIAKLYHPNIVSIYDVGSVDEHTLFYAMPYLQHGDLTGFAYHNDEELIRVMTGLCQGFAYAHAQGVVHRDIKPENILFDQFGNVKIADFGIALSSGKRRFTKDQRIVGSIHYLSPEQARSKHVDARSDIYGLGAILYEALTGQPVFDAPDDLAIMMAHVESPIPRLPEKVAHWQDVIDRCLAKSPNQRFQSMEALQKAIESITPQVDHGPIRRLTAWPYLLVSFALLSVMAGWWLWTKIMSPVTISAEQNISLQQSNKKQAIDFVSTQEENSETTDGNDVEDNPDPQLSTETVNNLLNQAKQNIVRKQLTTPTDDNALDKLLTVLADRPQQEEARQLLSEISDGYFELAYQAVLNKNHDQAESFADSVTTVRHKVALVDERLLKYLTDHSEMTVSLLLGSLAEQVRAAVSNNNRPQAERLINLTDVLMPDHRIVTELNEALAGMPTSGQVVTDKLGIQSVLITPQSNQSLGYGFYATQTEITMAQYQQFREATNRPLERCQSALKSNLIFSKRSLDNVGFSLSEDVPVVCVTWQDAMDYADWLSQQTGHSYELPTWSEWQLMASQTDQPKTCGQHNLAGREFPDKKEGINYYDCDDGFPHLAPVHSFASDGLGLNGVYGNAAEWLAGCEEPGKVKSFFSPDKPCDVNPAAGLSWLSDQSDGGRKVPIKYGDAYTHIGFRLIRR
ncbi:bifunctional serine/threonine-protein kinase/formylglycine-generating enzyme family protein [Marinicella gelatinilytica]|uniref:bifunctional serine/threonine-protein kinase/formylglycine-generating enzyme family protein n=1 Tax=Marinicella gelatinilytica TaxID=2996017 RepID=UPI002260E301|nr:bifunctional serine/threonine-protein kinase/formylglycine-generating enzyme family protein [Marinicella gelatinilytica]MCX7544517.1 bifunctional serine/threonine-protein kinase/formylglycine-generating enzyme family protein [Marinicella gelatinilytica]